MVFSNILNGNKTHQVKRLMLNYNGEFFFSGWQEFFLALSRVIPSLAVIKTSEVMDSFNFL